MEDVRNPEQCMVWFRRTLKTLDTIDPATDSTLKSFTDVIPGNSSDGFRAKPRRDVGAQYLLGKLKQDMSGKIKRIHEYELDSFAPGTGIDPLAHASYLQKLCDDFVAEMQIGVDAAASQVPVIQHDELLMEIYQHMQFARERSATLKCRDSVMMQVVAAAQQPDSLTVVHGASGCGKSSIMAQAFLDLSRQNPEAIVVCRFVGISAGSANIRSLLHSICLQLCGALKLKEKDLSALSSSENSGGGGGDDDDDDDNDNDSDEGGGSGGGCGEGEEEEEDGGRDGGNDSDNDGATNGGQGEGDSEGSKPDAQKGGIAAKVTIPDKIQELVAFFHSLLESVAARKRQLIIVLDSLDQLGPEYNGRMLRWLPKVIPANVRLVLSTLPDAKHECLPALLSRFGHTLTGSNPPGATYIQIHPLQPADCMDILCKALAAEGRGVSADQRTVLADAFAACSTPLFLKLCIEEARLWVSYKPVVLETTTVKLIHALFQRLEQTQTATVVKHALGYLTAARDGLSLIEIEDILSCDDEVLNTVFEWWLPPRRRLPPLIWARLRTSLGGFLVSASCVVC